MNKIVTDEEWFAQRRAFLAEEKSFQSQRDAIAARRQALPWRRIHSEYVFDTTMDRGPCSTPQSAGRRVGRDLTSAAGEIARISAATGLELPLGIVGGEPVQSRFWGVIPYPLDWVRRRDEY